MPKIFYALFIIVASVIFYACGSGSGSAGKKMLRFNLEKGKAYDYELVMDMDQEIMGQKNTIGLITRYAISITGDDGNVKTLDIEYSDFKMKMNMMGQEMNIDASEKPEPADSGLTDVNPIKMMSNAFSGIIGKKFTMTVDGGGKIQSITGVEEFIKNIAESMGGGEQVKAMVLASLQGQFSGKQIKETFAPMFAIYPNKEVQAGDKWSGEYQLTSQAVQAKTDYTLKAFEGDNAVVEAKSTMSPVEGQSNPNLAGLKLNGTQSGIITLNAKSGMVIDSELEQNFESSGDFKMKMIGKMKMRGKERK